MRTIIRVGLAAVCLGLASCTTPGPKPSPHDPPANPFPDPKFPAPGKPDQAGAPAEVDNLLAGQVLDKSFNKRISNASIQVVDLQDANPAPAARLDISASNDGYFFIPGLQRGHHYQLIARIKEGDRILSGTTLAMPPNPRLLIYLSEDYTTPTTPAPLGPPTVPGKTPADKDKDPAKTPGAPSASIDPPTKGRTDGGFDSTPPPGVAPPALDKTKVAGPAGAEPGGFEKYPAPPRVDIPNGPPANPLIPPPPPILPPPPSVAPSPPATPFPESSANNAPARRQGPPFCVLVSSNHLDDFALTTLEGQAWEFRRDPPRKLVLLDFWKSNCPPCQSAIPHLRGLQEKYRGDGLEVVGIAYEDEGLRADQIAKVRNARQWARINYTILMGAEARGSPCPVRSQFMVESFPRLVLIDETGDVLWRSSADGLSDQQYGELEMEIYRKFHPPSR